MTTPALHPPEGGPAAAPSTEPEPEPRAPAPSLVPRWFPWFPFARPDWYPFPLPNGSLVLALTTAAPAAWARVSNTGGPITGVVKTTNSNGGTTTTVTTSNGSSSTVTTTSTSSSGTTTQTTVSHSSNGTTTQSNSTTTSSGQTNTTTTVTDKNGNQTTTTSTSVNGVTTSSSTTVTAVSNGTATVQSGSMVILSTSDLAEQQNTNLVTNATVITLPPVSQGETEAEYQAMLEQFLQAHPADAQAIQNAQLAITAGGTGWVSSVMNQALADITNNTVLQVGGSNAVTGAQMLVQAANIFASSGLAGLESNLNALASMSGGTGGATDPWAGNGYASNANGYLAGVSLYQAPSVGFTGTGGSGGGGTGGRNGGGGGATTCPAGELGTPPNCYTQVLNPNPPQNPQPSSKWYAIAVPAWMNSWLNVGQQSLGNGDQTANTAQNSGQDTGNANSANYVPTAPAGTNMLQGGPVATLTNESAQVYGTYTVTSTQTETKYKTVTVPEQGTRMVAETQTVPGYWQQVPVTQPGYYSTQTVNHPGDYTSQSVDHPGYTTTEYHPGSCSSVYHPGHTSVTYVNGRPHVAYYPGWTSTSCSSGYTTSVYHPGYTTTELWHPAYTTSEQVWNPPTTVMQAEWVPPTTETVEVPQTYTAYVQEQQAYTVQVPVTTTETGWHTVTSTVAPNTVLSSANPGGQDDTAAAALYVSPVSGSSNPWIE